MAAPKTFKKYGWHRQHPNPNDLKYVPHPQIVANLPPKVDLRPECPPVYDQMALGACTSNAVAGDIEFLQMKEKIPYWTPSRLFIYYNERVLENTVGSDSGASLRDSINAVSRWGFASETMWPYDINKFTNKPSAATYTDAATHKVSQYMSVNQDPTDIKAALAAGDPVIFGFTVYESFESQQVANTGIMPMPKPGEQILGGHAVGIYGFDDGHNWVICRNSWAATWGDKGYFYMPYAFCFDNNYASDFWAIKVVPN